MKQFHLFLTSECHIRLTNAQLQMLFFLFLPSEKRGEGGRSEQEGEKDEAKEVAQVVELRDWLRVLDGTVPLSDYRHQCDEVVQGIPVDVLQNIPTTVSLSPSLPTKVLLSPRQERCEIGTSRVKVPLLAPNATSRATGAATASALIYSTPATTRTALQLLTRTQGHTSPLRTRQLRRDVHMSHQRKWRQRARLRGERRQREEGRRSRREKKRQQAQAQARSLAAPLQSRATVPVPGAPWVRMREVVPHPRKC